MLDLLGKRFSALFIAYFSVVTLGIAQRDAVILGKVDSPQSRIVRFEYKRNHFSLEEGIYEATLDTNNVFAIRIKLDEPRAIYCTHRENAVKLFVAPGDTLKMRFTGGKLSQTIAFDGNGAVHNDYLVKTQKMFPDWLNENALVKARMEKSSKAYLAYTDSLFLEKRRFFDSYPSDLKSNFTNEFLEFASNDIDYWRAYELMLYVKTYGLNNSDPIRMIDDGYFNFTLETDNIYYKALNNEYYLQYLELYLGYLSEKNGLGYKEPIEIVEEKSRYVKTVKPKDRNIRVIEEPFLPRDVVSWLAPNEEAYYQNLLTGEKFKYVGEDSTYEDIFLKIKTLDGKTGWVPQSAISLYEKTVVERTVRNRFCFIPTEPLCGFDKHLSGRVLYFTVAKDILYSCMYDNLDAIDIRIKNFISKNTDHQDLNKVLTQTQELTIQDRAKGINRLNIPASFDIEEYWKDRVYYARNLTKLRKSDAQSDIVIDYTPNRNATNQNNSYKANGFDTATKLTVKTKDTRINGNNVDVPTQPVVSTPVKADEPKVETQPTVKKEEPKAETPPAQALVTPPTVKKEEPKTETPPAQALVTPPTVKKEEPKAETPPAQALVTPPTVKKEEPKTETPPAQALVTPPTVKKEEPKAETPPVAPKTNENQPAISFSTGDNSGNIKFTIPEGFMPLVDYNPAGRIVEFKGMVVNEGITPFEFTDPDGNVLRQQDLLGKIVVLDFWATWCGPCKPTLEYTQRLANKYSDKEVVFVYISADSNTDTWKAYLKEHPMKGNHGLDDNGLLRINLRVPGVPNFFVIDKRGRIAHNSLIQSKYTAEEMIDLLLKTP